MNKIPKTDSVTELARFWDAHDLTEFESELEESGRRDRRIAMNARTADGLR